MLAWLKAGRAKLDKLCLASWCAPAVSPTGGWRAHKIARLLNTKAREARRAGVEIRHDVHIEGFAGVSTT